MPTSATDLSEDCPFCAIVRGEDEAVELLRSKQVVAFFPLDPATKGHTLVVPTAHVRNIWEASPEQVSDVTQAVLRVARAIRSTLNPPGLNIIQSNGAAATQSVAHLHVHVVPRYVDDALVLDWPEAGAMGSDAALAESLRQVIGQGGHE